MGCLFIIIQLGFLRILAVHLIPIAVIKHLGQIHALVTQIIFTLIRIILFLIFVEIYPRRHCLFSSPSFACSHSWLAASASSESEAFEPFLVALSKSLVAIYITVLVAIHVSQTPQVALAITALAYIQLVEPAFADVLLLQSPWCRGVKLVLIFIVVKHSLPFASGIVVFCLTKAVLPDFRALRVLLGGDGKGVKTSLFAFSVWLLRRARRFQRQ